MTEQTFTQPQPQQNQHQENQPCPDIFNSVDFGRFLSTELPKDKGGINIFLSKDNALPSFDVPSVFKSKEAFSKMFSSSDWEMKFPIQDPKTPDLPKSLPASATITPAAVPPPPPVENSRGSLASIMLSKEWMKMNTLGSHIDVSINREMFSATTAEPETPASSTEAELPAEMPPSRTNWDDMFYSQLQLVPPPLDPITESRRPQAEPSAGDLPPDLEDEQMSLAVEPATVTSQQLEEPEDAPEPSLLQASLLEIADSKKKRKRKPRKKVVPEVKLYVEPKDYDVLLGRGGRSNHHPGNKRYREEVKNLRSWYAGISEKDEKTDLSQCLVDYVHNYQGRFLDKDAGGWYEVPNIIARRKASQALREDTDPEKRAAKRARFLQKRLEVEKLKV